MNGRLAYRQDMPVHRQPSTPFLSLAHNLADLCIDDLNLGLQTPVSRSPAFPHLAGRARRWLA